MTLASSLSQSGNSELDWLGTAPLSEVYSYLASREGKRSGKDVKFLCSNHAETDASLFIDDRKEVGHCFGCDWKFNRWSLLREFGFNIPKTETNHTAQRGKRISREVEALTQLSRQGEAERLEQCATKFQVRMCEGCKETFVTAYHCDHRLCPICNRRHTNRFFEKHKNTLDYRLELWGVTLIFSGRPLSNNGQNPQSELIALITEVRNMIAQLRRKYEPVGLFQHAIIVRQIKIKRGVAYLKVHILLDCMRRDIDILRSYLASRYNGSPLRAAYEFWELDEAIAWLKSKASRPLQEWETTEDLRIWLEATKHMPLIYGLGNFRKVRGGRCKDKSSQERVKPVSCPFCGSTDTLEIAIVFKEEAWLWDKRLSPPSVIRNDNGVLIPVRVPQ